MAGRFFVADGKSQLYDENERMIVAALTWGLMTAWLVCAALGWQMLRQRRWTGAAFLITAALAIAAQAALSLVPVGIGEPLIRIERSTFFVAAGLALGACAAVLAWVRNLRPALHLPVRLLAPAAAFPIAAGLALWGLSFISTPERERERNPDRREIVLPPGFKAERYASAAPGPDGAMDNPTVIAFGDAGDLYIADIAGNLWLARDTNGDARIDTMRKFASGFELLVGLAWRNGELYVSSAGKVEGLKDANNDGIADARRTLAAGLPSMIVQPHSNNSLVFGPDGRLYFGVGSTVLHGEDPHAFGGAVVSVSTDGGDARVYARGFGNVFDLAFNKAGVIFAGDNAGPARDGAAEPDELNQIVEGGDYGAPDSGDPLNLASGKTPPLATFPAHATPTGMAFYYGQAFPAGYVDTAFLALWNRGEVMNIEINPKGDGSYAAIPRVFGSGFLYPIDVVVGPDDALYIADFGTSVVYRVTYEGAR